VTVFVSIHRNIEIEYWRYWYDAEYEMLSIEDNSYIYPKYTLQGAYELIVKADKMNAICYFETVGSSKIPYWVVQSKLEIPTATSGQISIMQDIDDGQQQTYFTDPYYRTFYARFGELLEPSDIQHIAIGKQVIVDVKSDGMLAGVWMLGGSLSRSGRVTDER